MSRLKKPTPFFVKANALSQEGQRERVAAALPLMGQPPLEGNQSDSVIIPIIARLLTLILHQRPSVIGKGHFHFGSRGRVGGANEKCRCEN